MATKLIEWLFSAALFLGIWVILLSNSSVHPLVEDNQTVVLYLPVISLILFGLYAVCVVLWRVYTFNDCEEASKELMEQIEEAKKDLKLKGFVFKETPVDN